VLPSPNGSTLAAESAAEVVLAACLRNASAVADYLNTLEGDVAIIAAGERWPDGSLRVALEDFIGAGAVVARWAGQKCIEAMAAQAVYERFSDDLGDAIRSTESGQELIERGFEEDVAFAASIDQSNAVPVLVDGAFRLGGG
jgi:2-phosphosulfolactate phosphatase